VLAATVGTCKKYQRGDVMKMQRIVVGLDGSAEAARALESAADLAVLTGAEVTAVTVFDAGPFMSWGIAPVYLPDFEQLREGLRQDLDSWCEPLRSRGVTHHPVVREGSAAEELLTEAESEPTDLIVVGSRGRGGFRELLLGSVAHHVTQHAKHPVVVLPRPAVRLEATTAATLEAVATA
jgi:nucleotide-binding universal stress UspA family protein